MQKVSLAILLLLGLSLGVQAARLRRGPLADLAGMARRPAQAVAADGEDMEVSNVQKMDTEVTAELFGQVEQEWIHSIQKANAGGAPAPAAAAAPAAAEEKKEEGEEKKEDTVIGDGGGPEPDGEFMKGCLTMAKAIVMGAKGCPGEVDEYLTGVCAHPRAVADSRLCLKFKDTLLGHMHPGHDEHEWNLKGMDYPLLCKGFYRVAAVHVSNYYPKPMSEMPVAAGSGEEKKEEGKKEEGKKEEKKEEAPAPEGSAPAPAAAAAY